MYSGASTLIVLNIWIYLVYIYIYITRSGNDIHLRSENIVDAGV